MQTLLVGQTPNSEECRVGQRIAHEIAKKNASQAHGKEKKHKAPMYKASEFRELMLALPLALCSLLEDELAEARDASGVELLDPCKAACLVIVHFDTWYGAARYSNPHCIACV